ncbi:MAG: hypothetical protein WCP29_17170 [Acidobacteriota bacterium]
MQTIGRLLACALLVALCPAPLAAQAPTRAPAAAPALPVVDVRHVGPQVGTVLPDFKLSDQHGVVRTRTSILGPSGGLLVFFRSADW